MTTFTDIILARLRVCIAVAGTSPSALSIAMGHHSSYLGRKLQAGGDGKRELGTAEIDEVLTALHLEPQVLMGVVWGPADQDVLSWLIGQRATTIKAAAKVFGAGASRSIERLSIQELVAVVGDDVSVTDAGRAVAPRPTKRRAS